MSHNVITKEQALEGMMRGVDLAVDLIRPTYGGNGTNVIVEEKLRPGHGIYNDAWSIVKAIKSDDPAERQGLSFVQEACEQADKLQGDARKTTLLMFSSILKDGIASSLPKMKLKRELDALIPLVESAIDARTVQITTNGVQAVATTASENEDTGKLFQEIYKQIGKEGIITIEGSGTYDTSYTITDGVRFSATGMLSPEMVYDEEAIAEKRQPTKAIYKKPLILVTKKKITSDDDINPLLVEMRNQGKKDLVIFTNDMDSAVASQLVALHKSGQYHILIIKAPVLWQNYVFEDFAKCVHATIVEDASGVSFKTLRLEHLGTCGRIEVEIGDPRNPGDTVINEFGDISAHIAHLQEKGDDDSKLRLSWLANKSALLRLGANSPSDLSYKRLKANDANRSTYLALKYGVVNGGGTCLWDISHELPDTEAGKILRNALQAPMTQAMENYGVEEHEYLNMLSERIVDASMVLKRAVRNAIGLASTILTAPAIVYIPPKTPEEMAYDIAMKQATTL